MLFSDWFDRFLGVLLMLCLTHRERFTSVAKPSKSFDSFRCFKCLLVLGPELEVIFRYFPADQAITVFLGEYPGLYHTCGSSPPLKSNRSVTFCNACLCWLFRKHRMRSPGVLSFSQFGGIWIVFSNILVLILVFLGCIYLVLASHHYNYNSASFDLLNRDALRLRTRGFTLIPTSSVTTHSLSAPWQEDRAQNGEAGKATKWTIKRFLFDAIWAVWKATVVILSWSQRNHR